MDLAKLRASRVSAGLQLQPPRRASFAMWRLALLILLPLAHAVRVVTPFRSAPVRMAASLPSVDPALKLVLRAAGDRGKADLSSLRALAGLIGMDDGLRALEEQLGISENVTDTDIQARALTLAQPCLIRTPTLRHQGDAISTPTAAPPPGPCVHPYPYPSPNSACSSSHSARRRAERLRWRVAC